MTAKEKIQTGILRAVKMQEVPKEKLPAILKRLTLGVAVCWLGVEGMRLEWNQYLVVGLFFVGGNLISNQMLTGFAKTVIEPIGAMVKAVKGGE